MEEFTISDDNSLVYVFGRNIIESSPLQELEESIKDQLIDKIQGANNSQSSVTLSIVFPREHSNKFWPIIKRIDHYFQTTEGYYFQTSNIQTRLEQNMLAMQIIFFWDDGKTQLEDAGGLGVPVESLLGGFAIQK